MTDIPSLLSLEAATALISSFSGLRLVVLGDIMLDDYIHGDVSRISPEAPVPVLDVREHVFRLGGAANAAANVASLGGLATIVGVVGEDDASSTLAMLLGQAGVDAHGLVVAKDRPTTSKSRIIARGQQVVRLDRESKKPLDAATEDRLIAAFEDAMRGAAACIVSDYAKGVASDRVVAAVVAAATRASCPIVVDPKARAFAKYAGATVLTPNHLELEIAIGRPTGDSDDDVVAAALELLPQLRGGALLVTRGARGMSIIAPAARPVHFPTMAKAVYDVVGAGDTVVSTLALGLAAGGPMHLAADLANRAAGIVVSKPGTATVSQAELHASLTSP